MNKMNNKQSEGKLTILNKLIKELPLQQTQNCSRQRIITAALNFSTIWSSFCLLEAK
jgi:hypothetical protein